MASWTTASDIFKAVSTDSDPGACEEYPIEPGGRDGGKPLRKIESYRMTHLEGWSEIERSQLPFDRLNDLPTARALH